MFKSEKKKKKKGSKVGGGKVALGFGLVWFWHCAF